MCCRMVISDRWIRRTTTGQTSEDVGRLIYRSLTFAKDTPGEDLSIQPDLAESLGTSSDDGRTWTYRLREGLKYEDGLPITAQDVKYGVMRSFESDVFTDRGHVDARPARERNWVQGSVRHAGEGPDFGRDTR